MLLSLAEVVLANAAAAPAPTTSGQLPALFIAACLDGTASAAAATPIEFDALPSGLRSRLGHPSTARVWQLSVSGGAYLYSLTYTDRGWGPKVCGVASEDMGLQSASAAVETRLRGAPSAGSYRPQEWVDPKGGYRALAMRAGGFTILQINTQNEIQTEAQAPR
jgi:hypothetical protein